MDYIKNGGALVVLAALFAATSFEARGAGLDPGTLKIEAADPAIISQVDAPQKIDLEQGLVAVMGFSAPQDYKDKKLYIPSYVRDMRAEWEVKQVEFKAPGAAAYAVAPAGTPKPTIEVDIVDPMKARLKIPAGTFSKVGYWRVKVDASATYGIGGAGQPPPYPRSNPAAKASEVVAGVMVWGAQKIQYVKKKELLDSSLDVTAPIVGKNVESKLVFLNSLKPNNPDAIEWKVNDKFAGVGEAIKYLAEPPNTNAKILYDVAPRRYVYSVAGVGGVLSVYPEKEEKEKIKFPTNALKAVQDAMAIYEQIKIGDYLPFNVSKPKIKGEVSLANQWKEDSIGPRVHYVWTLGAKVVAECSVKAKIGTALLGFPPALAEADIFIEAKGELGIDGTASLNDASEIKVSGGDIGKITISMGGEADIAAGITKIVVKGETSLEITGQFYGQGGGPGTPPQAGSQVKATVKPLKVIYEISAGWGFWTNGDSWTVFKEQTLYDDKVVLFPW